jgi:hypothetical protein
MLLLLLSLSEQPCYVARLGNFGEVDLRFYLRSGGSLPRRRPGPGRKMLSYPYRFILFDRARVGLLLGNAHFRQDIQNYLGLYLKLSGQIIDSNFHPLSISSKYLLHDHNDLTVCALNLTTKVLLPILHPAFSVPVLPGLRSLAVLRHACALRPHQRQVNFLLPR